MTTIESAAISGVEAAAEIVERHGIGDPVEVLEPRSLPGGALRLAARSRGRRTSPARRRGRAATTASGGRRLAGGALL